MRIFKVTHIQGNYDYTYWSVGDYSTMALARKARANYALAEGLIEQSQYHELWQNSRKCWHDDYHYIQIEKSELDSKYCDEQQAERGD